MRILTLVLALIGLHLSFAQFCPPPSIISPCQCVETEDLPPFISCYQIRDEFNLKGVFDNVSSFLGGNNTLFDSLSIYGTPIREIEDGTFDNFQFTEVYILHNFNLTSISPRAFNSSRYFTKELTVQDNGVKNDTNIFEFVRNFHGLEYLNIGYDQITSVPSYAFHRNPFLREIIIQHNQIGNRIESHAFDTGLFDSLRYVELWNNTMPSKGLPNDAFAGIVDSVKFSLTCNDMEFLEESSFRTLLDLAAQVEVVGDRRRCFDAGNAEGFYCDERVNWICNDEGRYAPKLTGYICKADSGFADIWEYCASRNGTVNL